MLNPDVQNDTEVKNMLVNESDFVNVNNDNLLQNCDNRFFSVIPSITDRLMQSGYRTERTKVRGNTISNLRCPECGDKTAWAYADKPFSINCNKLNHCGIRTKTLSLFPDILRNIEFEHPPTDADPHYPATFYLHTRGLNKSLSGLRYEYWQNIRNTGSGGVMFPIPKSDNETVYNGRLFNPPDKEGKTHNKNSTSGVFWQHPAMEYNMSSATYVTEGIIDALSLIEIGKQAIAVLSAGNTPSNTDLSEFEYLIFAFDNDPAGRRATQKWKEAYPKADAILPIRDTGDWNAFLIRNGHNAEKEFDEKFDSFREQCEKLDEQIKKDIRDAEIFRHIRKLNEKHAVVMLGGKCIVISEVEDPTFKRRDIAFSSVNDFRNFYSNQRVSNPEPGKNRTVSISDLWLKDKKRRQYDGLIFNPGADIPGYYNLWRGFCIKPKQGNWDLLRRHIWEVICSENEEYFTWLMAWFARMIQNPGEERPGTAVVLKGKRGTGKGCLVNQFRYFFGTHFLHITNQRQLTGNFNSHLKDALMVFCDEGFWAGSKNDEGALKALITEPTIQIEPKGRDSFSVKNYVNLLIASNNNWVIPAGLEERRFFVLEVNDRHIQDTGYFRKIWEQMNDGGREAMFYDLLKLDISDVDLRRAPKTEALIEQIENSMGPLQSWWYECLIKGENVNVSGIGQWSEFIGTEQLHSDYLAYCKELEIKGYRMSEKQLGRKIKSLCKGIENYREGTGERKRGFLFPSLEDCRNSFSEMIGYSIRWEEDKEEE